MAYVALRPMHVRERRPEEAAAHVDEAEQADETGRGAAVIAPGNISWIIGDACPSTPMPAVTLRHSTTHSSQNCGVVIARSAVTLPVVTMRARRLARVHPAGFQPGRRHAHGEHAEHHEAEVEDAHRDERLARRPATSPS